MKRKRLLALLLLLSLILGSVHIPANAATKTYWIKVNKEANVATVYQKKNGDWIPIKAMLTSCGGNYTPEGTFNTTEKYRWHELVGHTFGQYNVRIHKRILFHSVWYYKYGDPKSQSVEEFNKLGETASHGCVRLSTEDAKWIYDNCKIGTKVTIYSSKDPGPLGKPDAYKMPESAGSRNWDPTDPDENNPWYKTLPLLSQKVKKISFGNSTYNKASLLVEAIQNNGKAVKELKTNTKIYNEKAGKYEKAKFSSKVPGKYKITYTAIGKKDVSIKKTFYFTVGKDTKKPTVTVTKNPSTICIRDIDAARWLVSAKMQDGTDRMTAAKVSIKKPGSDDYGSVMSYKKAKDYKFTKSGSYTIKYEVSNKNKTSVITTKTVTVNVAKPMITTPYGKTIEVNQHDALNLMDYAQGFDYDGTPLEVSVDGFVDTEVPASYDVNYTITGTDIIVVSLMNSSFFLCLSNIQI